MKLRNFNLESMSTIKQIDIELAKPLNYKIYSRLSTFKITIIYLRLLYSNRQYKKCNKSN